MVNTQDVVEVSEEKFSQLVIRAGMERDFFKALGCLRRNQDQIPEIIADPDEIWNVCWGFQYLTDLQITIWNGKYYLTSECAGLSVKI